METAVPEVSFTLPQRELERGFRHTIGWGTSIISSSSSSLTLSRISLSNTAVSIFCGQFNSLSRNEQPSGTCWNDDLCE